MRKSWGERKGIKANKKSPNCSADVSTRLSVLFSFFFPFSHPPFPSFLFALSWTSIEYWGPLSTLGWMAIVPHLPLNPSKAAESVFRWFVCFLWLSCPPLLPAVNVGCLALSRSQHCPPQVPLLVTNCTVYSSDCKLRQNQLHATTTLENKMTTGHHEGRQKSNNIWLLRH